MASAYRARVKDDIAALVENFSTLVQSARISDDNIGQDKRAPSDFPEVLAQKVVYAGQSLLALIGEIKRNAIVSDFKARNRDVTNLRARYAAAEAASEAKFLDLQARIHAVREEIEGVDNE